MDEAAAELGGVDLVVANVGGSVGGGLLAATPEDWQETFDLNPGRNLRMALPRPASGTSFGPPSRHGSPISSAANSLGAAWEHPRKSPTWLYSFCPSVPPGSTVRTSPSTVLRDGRQCSEPAASNARLGRGQCVAPRSQGPETQTRRRQLQPATSWSRC